MIRKFNIITSSLLLLVFILPSIVKLEHHHKHLISETQTASPVFSEKCVEFAVSNFLFSYQTMFLQVYQRKKPQFITSIITIPYIIPISQNSHFHYERRL